MTQSRESPCFRLCLEGATIVNKSRFQTRLQDHDQRITVRVPTMVTQPPPPADSEDESKYQIPSKVDGYDVDTEYAYIMAKAMRSYREHCGKSERPRPQTAAAVGRASDQERRVPVLTRTRAKSANAASSVHQQQQRQCATPKTTISSSFGPSQIYRQQLQHKRVPLSGRLRRPKMHRQRPMSCSLDSAMAELERIGESLPGETDCAGGEAENLMTRSAIESRKEAPMTKVNIKMDKIGIHDTPEKKGKRNSYHFHGGFYSNIRSPRKQYFTIHPDWVSENLSVQRLSLQERTATFPPRRCRSAPPSATRSPFNPITWEKWW